MNHNLESLSPSESAEPISTKWDNLAESDNKEQNINTSKAEKDNNDTIPDETSLEKLSFFEDDPPEDYRTVNDIVKLLDSQVSWTTIDEVVKELKNEGKIEGQLFKRKFGKQISYYSPREIEIITNSEKISKILSLKDPEPGYKTINEIAIENDLSPNSLRRIIEKLEKEDKIEGKTFRKEGKPTRFYSQKEIETILEDKEIKELLSSIKQIPDGWKTAAELADELISKGFDINAKYIRQVAKKLGIKGKKINAGNAGPQSSYYSPDQIQQILNDEQVQHFLSLKNPEPGYKTRHEIIEEYLSDSISETTIRNIAKKLGIKGKEFRAKNSNNGAIYYSPDEIQQILNDKQLNHLLSLKDPEPGYKTAAEIVNEKLLGKFDVSYIRTVTKRLGIKGKEFRIKDKNGRFSGAVIHYSPDEIQQILDDEQLKHLLSLENPKSGYKTATDIAREDLLGAIGYQYIIQIAGKKGIEGQEFRIINKNGKRSGGSAIYYSPDEIQQILDDEQLKHFLSLETLNDSSYMTKSDIASYLDLSDGYGNKVLTDIIERLGIQGKEFRIKTKDGQKLFSAIYYSPKEIQLILNDEELLYFRSLKDPEPGYKTANEIAREELKNETSGNNIASVAKKLNIQGKEFRRRDKKGLGAIYYSPDEIQRILNDKQLQHFLSLENPKPGYKTAYEMEKEIRTKGAKTTAGHISDIAKKLSIKGEEFKRRDNIGSATYYSLDEQATILEELEGSTTGTSFPENAIAFYLKQTGLNIQQGIRPDWMKNPDSGRNLEIDIFISSDNPPPPGIGIEYDGVFWHKNPEYDARKNILAKQQDIEIIHIREQGCPELPEDIMCINRQDNNDNHALADCISQCFTILNIPLPETGIDISRDQSEIYSFMNARGIGNIDSITEETIEDGILAVA